MPEVYKGATSQSWDFYIRDSSTGAAKTGLTYTSISAAYKRTRGASTSITPATLASASSSWRSGGFKEIDSDRQPGLYRLDIPDAAFATGAEEVTVSITGSGITCDPRSFSLVAWNNQNGGANGTVPTDVIYITGTSASGLYTLNSVIDSHFFGGYDANSSLGWLLDFADQWHSGNVFPPDFSTLSILSNAVATYSTTSSGGSSSSDDNGVS